MQLIIILMLLLAGSAHAQDQPTTGLSPERFLASVITSSSGIFSPETQGAVTKTEASPLA